METSGSARSSPEQPSEVLIHLRGILENAVEKLKDSNRQLQAAIDSGDRDAEFFQAVGVGHLSESTLLEEFRLTRMPEGALYCRKILWS